MACKTLVARSARVVILCEGEAVAEVGGVLLLPSALTQPARRRSVVMLVMR